MIISRTPFRISFFGGGTDYPEWYRRHGGTVLSTSFDKYCYITCRELPPFFAHKYHVAYSRVETTTSADDIEHPAVRGVLKEMDFSCGLELHCDADLPARSGLGSSSSFVVGLLHALHAQQGRRVSKEFLATEAIRIEQEVLREHVGSQDQTAAAYGGFNLIHFDRDGSINVEPLVMNGGRRELLNDHLMLCFTGLSRIASEIAKGKIARLESQASTMGRIHAMVNEAVAILTGSTDIRQFGELLHSAWMEKRSLFEMISNDRIDDLYARARSAGAIGGKLLGAGGGGFMLLFVEPSKQEAVRAALPDHIHVPIKFESAGSQIIYYRP